MWKPTFLRVLYPAMKDKNTASSWEEGESSRTTTLPEQQNNALSQLHIPTLKEGLT